MPPSQAKDAAGHERDMAGRCDLNSAIFTRLGAELGFAGDLGLTELARFERYASEIVVANARHNLTRITRPDEIAIRHFLDSLMCLRGMGPLRDREDLRLVDVGAGPGLPGIALALVRPTWQLCLVESVAKKAAFLRHLTQQPALDLRRVTVQRGRAEAVGQDPGHRETYDLAVARAVAALPTLMEYLLPLVRVGGRAIALKGSDIAAELASAAPAIATLGGRLVESQPYTLPTVEGPRHLVIVEKVEPTPTDFPRREGTPAKQPIG